jgi:DNA-binding transcriptional MocR family regulator
MTQLDLSRISLDRGVRTPLAEQLYEALESRISAGQLSESNRLPPSRELAARLKVNRATVQAAYRRLQREGLVEARVGSGTVVRGPAPKRSAFDLSSLLSRGAAELPADWSSRDDPEVADFSRLTPDERFFPLEEFTRTLSYAWSRRRDLWQYAPPLGLEELRREVSRRLSEQGIERSPAEILVTSGAQQGLDLIFRTFTNPGDLVAVESPTYPGALAVARLAGVEIVPLPIGPQGPDPSPLLGRRMKLVYLMPERQNPTGVTTGNARREAVLEAAMASGALLIEDGYEEAESGLTPLAARRPDRTIWLGTLSKDLVPGLRIGWIAAPAPVLEHLARVKGTVDFQTPLPLQAAVAAFLRGGGDRRARRIRGREVEFRREVAARALAEHLPGTSFWGGEAGNALFWLHLPGGVSGRRVAQAAAFRGVGVAPGADFDPHGTDLANLRLSVSRVERRAVDRGIRILGEALRQVRAHTGAANSLPVV